MSANPDPFRVLVVDDERVIADSLVLILCARGYRVRAAYSAEDAMEVARNFRPQALISDVVLPGINGIELTTYFAHHHPACQVLLMSGNASTTGLLEDARRHGHVVPFVCKPVHPQEIFAFLDTCRPAEGEAFPSQPA